MTTVEVGTKKPPLQARPNVPLSANTVARGQKRAAPQPLRAYADNRRKFITDKLFSPVLKSQGSQGFEQVAVTSETRNRDMVEEVIVQGGLRPRVTRTAEGGSRSRVGQRDNNETQLLPEEERDRQGR